MELLNLLKFKNFFIFSIIFSFFIPIYAHSQILTPSNKEFFYHYTDREHSISEQLIHLSGIYSLSWLVYFGTQKEKFLKRGSWKNFRSHFGKVVFDKDEPIWNWVGHPYTGSQYYLFYRAKSYSRMQALKMAFLQSALFEFGIEIYTEPASVQDLYQTPILGAVLGYLLEISSIPLINSDFFVANIVGHILNPSTLFWFYEGIIKVSPTISPNGASLNLYADF